MKMARTLELMKIERECIKRQYTPDCCKDDCGCGACDLVQNTDELLEAYDEVIDHYQCMINSIETFIKYVKEGD